MDARQQSALAPFGGLAGAGGEAPAQDTAIRLELEQCPLDG
jgi:hypothetical protein